MATRTERVSRFVFRLPIALVAIGALWIVSIYFVVPSIIKSAYRGESLSFLNAMISGQAIHPVEHYLKSWEAITWRLLTMVFGIGIVAVLCGVFLAQKTRLPLGIRMLLAADVSLGLAYLLLVTILPPSWFITQFINLNAEANLPSWYSSTKLFLIAVLLSVFAYKQIERNAREKWVLILAPVVFALLSLDETARIHEWLSHKMDALLLSSGDRTSSLLPRTGIWMFALAPVFLGVILFIGRSAKEFLRDRRTIVRKYVLGVVIFVGSAAGTEIISNFVGENTLGSILQVFCEELGEMLGVTVLLWATWGLLVSYHFSLVWESKDHR